MKGAPFTESAKRERGEAGSAPGGARPLPAASEAGAEPRTESGAEGPGGAGAGGASVPDEAPEVHAAPTPKLETAPAPEFQGCQYLFGDPKGAWRLCGEPVFRRSYCARHYRRCYARPGTAAHRSALLDIRRCLKLLRAWDGMPVRGEPPMPRP